MARLLMAQNVNTALGGAVVGPGDIDDLQDEFLEACYTIAVEVPRLMRASKPKKGKR